jgi:hypothetical protein
MPPRETVEGGLRIHEVDMIEAFDDLETAAKLKNAIIVKVDIHHDRALR